MSKILSAKEICEQALAAGRAFPTSESAAPPEFLRRAMTWLDLIMAEEAGAGELFFLQPDTLSITVTNGTATYDLNQALGTNLPVDKVQFPVEAWLEDQSGKRYPIEIATFEKFEAIDNADRTGRPEWIYIDRLPASPKLTVRPYPPADDPNTWTLKLKVQTYAPNVSPGGVTGTLPSASVLTGFRQAWQRWLIFRLAADLFCGPIRKLPQSDLDRFERNHTQAKLKLLAFENQQHDTEAPVSEAWN